MAQRKATQARFLQREIASQQKWIKDHGNTMSGYIERYGSAGSLACHGEGGEAIFKADYDHLLDLEKQLRALKP